jgi:hypothetical protein
MLGRVPTNGQSGLKSHTAWMAKSPPPFPLHELHKPKVSKGEGVLGVEGQAEGDRGGHRETHREGRGGGWGGQRQRHRQPEREGKGRELYLRRRLLRSTGGA